MPRWLGRILYAFRGKRRVRLHLEVKPGTPVETVEGVMIGRWSGHYVLLLPRVVEHESHSVPLEGTLEVPSERVILVQVLP